MTSPDPRRGVPPHLIILSSCAGLVLTMIGVFAFAALLPAFMAEWDLTNTQAGWLGGILFAGYAGAAPILVALTDRIDARRVFMAGAFLAGVANLAFALVADGFWSALVLRALAGVGLAGTYMPGLRVLVDRITAARRAGAVPLFTASFSLGSAISYLVPVLVAELAGWRGAFTVAGISALAAVAVIGWMPARPPEQPEDSGAGALLDFRPVFASRPTMGYALGYVAHMWELFAFRAWIVAFLGFAAVLPGAPGTGPAIGGAAGLLAPGVVATWGALVAMACSIGGARIATRFGRAGTTQVYMATSALMALVFGWLAGLPYPLLAGLAIVYAGLIQLDSAALTTGAVETAPAGRRGATLAVHSLLGFGAAFLGPLGFGIVLDLAGGRESMTAWGIAFGMLGVIGLLGIPPLRMARRSRHGPASVPPAC